MLIYNGPISKAVREFQWVVHLKNIQNDWVVGNWVLGIDRDSPLRVLLGRQPPEIGRSDHQKSLQEQAPSLKRWKRVRSLTMISLR